MCAENGREDDDGGSGVLCIPAACSEKESGYPECQLGKGRWPTVFDFPASCEAQQASLCVYRSFPFLPSYTIKA